MSKYVKREITASTFEDDGFLERVEEHVTISLRKCPCCGKPARIQHIEYEDDDWLIAECPNCGLHSAKCQTYEDCAELWNVRTPRPAVRKTVRPCPFCGGKAGAGFCEDAPDFAFVECDNCGASSATFANPQSAIKAWNMTA